MINFNFFHLKSSNITFVEGITGDNEKKVIGFKSYLILLKSENIILDHEKRKNIIVKKMHSICNNKNLKKILMKN